MNDMEKSVREIGEILERKDLKSMVFCALLEDGTRKQVSYSNEDLDAWFAMKLLTRSR